MDFWALSPEINSARMYSGPGSAPLMAAAAAWTRLASELHSTAAAYTSVISGLTSQGWLGPSSVSMATAAAPYIAWMTATAAQAEQTAAQVKAAVGAYEAAFVMTVPPAAIAANRSTTMSLIQTNILGQNTAAIATNEAQYGEMWAQDTAAMASYAGSSAAASTLTPFTSPLQNTNPAGLAAQAATPAATAAQTATPAAQAALSAAPAAVSAAPAAASAAPAASVLSSLLSAALPTAGSDIPELADLDLLVLLGISLAGTGLLVAVGQYTEELRHDEVEENEAANGEPGSDSGPHAEPHSEIPALVSRPGSGAGVSAFTGRSASISGLSVPQGWALPPAVRQVAALLPSTAAPIFVQDGSDSPYTGMAMGGLMGTGMAGFAARGGSSATSAQPTPGAPAAGAAAARPAARTPAIPAAAPGAGIPGLPAGLPPGVVANLAATLAAIPGATIIVVPPSPTE